jgi:hypothetical protein
MLAVISTGPAVTGACTSTAVGGAGGCGKDGGEPVPLGTVGV